MTPTVVDRLHKEFSDLIRVLDLAGEVSLRSVADDIFRKALLMSAASFFERRMTESVLQFVVQVTAEDHVLTWLIRNKVVSRQYHTWFDWEEKNANNFFGLFGVEFREHMKTLVEQDDTLRSSIQAFLEVGRERNRLVHQDFASFSLEKTAEEIYKLYCSACNFVECFPSMIKQFADGHTH
jgi:HEPN superfamily RiboL-PSP-like protein